MEVCNLFHPGRQTIWTLRLCQPPCGVAEHGAAQLKAQTKRECDALTEAAEHKRAQTEADCAALRAKTEQEIAARRAAFEQSTRELLRSRCDTDILPEEGKVK